MTGKSDNRDIEPSHQGTWVLRAHAKVNLSLEVVGVRPDGYHLLRTVFQTLDLHDVLTFRACDGPFALSCDADDVPGDRRNLVWKAAESVWLAAGRRGEPCGLRVDVAKRIPAQGGLGGGSSDAATALVALDAAWQAGLGMGRLEEIGARLGADVPFFLHGGTALALGRGDEIQEMPDIPRMDVVLVFPPFGVSTPEAFSWFDGDAAARPGPSVRASRPGLADPRSLVGSRPALPLADLVNDLQAPVSRRHPEIDAACRALEAAGAEAARMSGSGSTVFGLFVPGRGRRAAEAVASAGWRTLVTSTAPRETARVRLD